MVTYPMLNELYEAIIKDCYDYLESNSDGDVKKSIIRLLENEKDKPEIAQKLYVVLCSVKNMEPSVNDNSSIFVFTKTYIEAIYYYFVDQNHIDKISLINDCCNSYITLFGYSYIFDGVFENEFLLFSIQYYKNFAELLNKYNISKDVQKFYEIKLGLLTNGNNIEINAYFFNDFLRNFQEESLDYKKLEKQNINLIKINEYQNNRTPKTSNTDIQNSEAGENGKQLTEIRICEISNTKTEKKNYQIEAPNSTNKVLNDKIKLLEDKINLLENELSIVKNDFKNELLFYEIERIYDRNKILEQLILDSEFHSTIITIEKKRNDYQENLINSLRNTIKSLGNPYNFNLWRKLSNIILKNIFVILYKKNYTFSQYFNSSVLNQLKYYESKLPEEKKISYKKKIQNYEKGLKEQNQNIYEKGNSAADKEKNYNLIIINNNIKYSLSIDFLLYLKEKGNKINYLDQEIIDLILFEDLNIKIIKKEEYNEKEECNIQPEDENEQYIYKGKINFYGHEIIDMLKNPLKYHKNEINMSTIYSYINNKINDIKEKTGYIGNKEKFNDLKYNAKQLGIKIEYLILSYQKFFIENRINFNNEKKIESIGNNNENIQKYEYLLELKEKNINKIKLYDNIEKDLESLNDIKLKSIEKLDKLINEIKNENIEKVKLLSLSDIFDEFKNVLKDKIKNGEYQDYEEIFNENNINDFNIDDVYSFLEDNLNYSNALFSIIKKDITNFNFLIKIITEYNELKYYIYNKDLDILI